MSHPVKVITERGEYRGKVMFVIKTEGSGKQDKYPFSFGLSKAKKILACIDEIKQYVEEEEAKRKGKKGEDDDE